MVGTRDLHDQENNAAITLNKESKLGKLQRREPVERRAFAGDIPIGVDGVVNQLVQLMWV